MGLLEIITGRRKLQAPAADRLFAMSTAYVTLDTGLGITNSGAAAIVFQPLSTADFDQVVTDMEAVVRATNADSDTTLERSDDSYGFRWLIVRGKDFEGLVVGINAISSALKDGGYGERLLCAVFGFTDRDSRRLYWIYNLQARARTTRSSPRAAPKSVTASASSSSGPRSARSCRSSRSSGAGSRCGEFRVRASLAEAAEPGSSPPEVAPRR